MKRNLNLAPSYGVMMSYGVGRFLAEFLTGAYGIMAFFFYEKEMGLPAIYPTIATVIYSIWNAVNDPLIGWITGKKPVLAKYGKRLFWIVAGLVACSLAFLLIFMVPQALQSTKIAVFAWMVFAVCLYDAAYSLWEVNYQGVFPDKFRSQDVRRKAAVTSTAFGSVGIALGAVLPPLFYHYGDVGSYVVAGLVIAAIGIVGSILIIPGVLQRAATVPEKEQMHPSPASGQMRPATPETAPQKEPGFVESLTSTVKHREFRVLAIMLFLYQSACICMTGSVNYVVNGVLGMPAAASTPIFAAMLVGALISVVLWSKVAKRLDNNFMMLVITNFFMAAAALPMTFCRTQMTFAVFMFLWGLGFGGCWTFIAPAMADVVDSIVLKERRRNEGVIMGVRAFFMRLSYASQGIVFWLCHTLTRYDASAAGLQTPLAQWGITAHIGLVPSLFFLAAALLLLLARPISADTARANRVALKELGL